jgi:hypothetical protein
MAVNPSHRRTIQSRFEECLWNSCGAVVVVVEDFLREKSEPYFKKEGIQSKGVKRDSRMKMNEPQHNAKQSIDRMLFFFVFASRRIMTLKMWGNVALVQYTL